MKSRLLQSVRWILIVVFSAFLLYLAYAVVISIFPKVFRGEADFSFMINILAMLFMAGLLGLFPAIMLHSLLTKKLHGFASSVGAILSLTAFYGSMSLIGSKNLMGFIDHWLIASPSSGGILKIVLGLAIMLGLLILPFWLLARMIRLTNEWIYPRLFKPLEDKI